MFLGPLDFGLPFVVQDYMRNKYDASAFQMMFFMNLWSGLYTVCYLISPYGGLDEVASALADSLVSVLDYAQRTFANLNISGAIVSSLKIHNLVVAEFMVT